VYKEDFLDKLYFWLYLISWVI